MNGKENRPQASAEIAEAVLLVDRAREDREFDQLGLLKEPAVYEVGDNWSYDSFPAHFHTERCKAKHAERPRHFGIRPGDRIQLYRGDRDLPADRGRILSPEEAAAVVTDDAALELIEKRRAISAKLGLVQAVQAQLQRKDREIEALIRQKEELHESLKIAESHKAQAEADVEAYLGSMNGQRDALLDLAAKIPARITGNIDARDRADKTPPPPVDPNAPTAYTIGARGEIVARRGSRL